MNLRLAQEAKKVAFDTIKQNIGTILTIILIAGMPMVFCNLYIASFFSLDEILLENITVEMAEEILIKQAIVQGLSFIVQLIFYPITIASAKIFLNMYFEKTASLNNLFLNYSSISRVLKSFKLYFTVFFIMLIKVLPYAVVVIALTLGLEYIYMYNDTLGLVLILPFYGTMLYTMFKAVGAYIFVLIYENLCILNFDNSDFLRKKAYYQLKTIINKKNSELSKLGISYFLYLFIACMLSTLTLGISIFLFYVYFIISIVFYVTKHNTDLLPNNKKYEGE